MSYLSTALTRLSERRQMKPADIARESGISKSFLSRFLSGENKELSDQSFLAVLKIFAADPQAQAEMVAARCMDAKAAAAGTPGAERVEIVIKNVVKTEHREVELPQVHLSQETERAFAWLRSQCPLNPDLEKHLVGYARLTGMK